MPGTFPRTVRRVRPGRRCCWHRYGRPYAVTGDPRVVGRVYFASGGRGIFYGAPR